MHTMLKMSELLPIINSASYKCAIRSDALESHEYWLVRSVTLHGIYRIVSDLSRSFEFAWTAIKSEDVLSVLDETAISHEFVNADMSAEQIYNIAQGNLSASKAYDLQDFLYDRIAELPWAQLLKINKVDAFKWNGAKFGVAYIHDNAEQVTMLDTSAEIGTFTDSLQGNERATAIVYDYYHNKCRGSNQQEWVDYRPAVESTKIVF